MCIAPLQLPDGTQVACHGCWQCREQAINDWVGRNIAESLTAKACHAVTLTYGRSRAGDVDHERAVILTYSDVQKYLKLLRRHGYPVRYFVTGEFGSAKGRAHWHIMLYWQDRVPPHELDRQFMHGRFDEKTGEQAKDENGDPAFWWPHGFSFWTRPTHAAVRYNCKYIQKDIGEAERQGHLAMSKKPPLGAEYFRRMAEQYVAEGLAPQTLEYRFGDVRRRKQDGTEEVVPFMLKDRSAELFLEHFVTTWQAIRPGQHMPASDLVEEFMDRGAWSNKGDEDRARDLRVRERLPDVPKPKRADLYSWMDGRNVEWDKNIRAWVAPGWEPGTRVKWSWNARKGAYGWRKIKTTNGSGSR